jgi:hypothetical protein
MLLMINMMKEINMSTPLEVAIRRLANEHPDWIPVLEAATAVAATAEENGGEFAGASVVNELSRRGASRRIPNLRILASYGLIEKSGVSTRGGRRAYYRMPARTEVERVLEIQRAHARSEKPRKLRFIASGRSTEPDKDTARRSGEMTYEPGSWR